MRKESKVGRLILLGALTSSSVLTSVAPSACGAAVINPTVDAFFSVTGVAVKEGIDLSLAVIKGFVSTFSVPIFLFIFFGIIYHNYFVLKGGSVQNVVRRAFSLPFKGMSFVYEKINNLFEDRSSKPESKDLVLNGENNSELISIHELKKELRDLESELAGTNVGVEGGNLDDEKDARLKNKILELKSRIWATRGVFSDRKFRNFASWSNSFWYYLTTAFFWSTRQEYNKLEKRLEDYERTYEDISEVRKLFRNFQSEDGNKKISLNDLLGNSGNVGAERCTYDKVKEIIEKINKFSGSLGKLSEALKENLASIYLKLVCEAIKKQINEDQSKIGEIKKDLSDNIGKFESLFSEGKVKELEGFVKQLEDLESIVVANEVFRKIKDRFGNLSLKEQLEGVLNALQPGLIRGFVSGLLGSGKFSAEQEKLLLDYLKNYRELEACYNLCSGKKVYENIFNFNGNVESFKENLHILNIMFEDKDRHDILLKVANVLESVNKFTEETKNKIKKIDIEGGKFSDCCDKMLSFINSSIKELYTFKENILPPEEGILKTTVSSKFDSLLNSCTLKSDQVKGIRERVCKEWLSVVSRKTEDTGIEKIYKKDLKKIAEAICESKEVELEMEKLESPYKDVLLEQFKNFKEDLVMRIKKELEEKINGVYGDPVLKFKKTVSEVDKFIRNCDTEKNAEKKRQFKELCKQLKFFEKIRQEDLPETREKCLPEDFDEDKLKRIFGFIELYEKIDAAAAEFYNKKANLSDFLNKVSLLLGSSSSLMGNKLYLYELHRHIYNSILGVIDIFRSNSKLGDIDEGSISHLKEISKKLPEGLKLDKWVSYIESQKNSIWNSAPIVYLESLGNTVDNAVNGVSGVLGSVFKNTFFK